MLEEREHLLDRDIEEQVLAGMRSLRSSRATRGNCAPAPASARRAFQVGCRPACAGARSPGSCAGRAGNDVTIPSKRLHREMQIDRRTVDDGGDPSRRAWRHPGPDGRHIAPRSAARSRETVRRCGVRCWPGRTQFTAARSPAPHVPRRRSVDGASGVAAAPVDLPDHAAGPVQQQRKPALASTMPRPKQGEQGSTRCSCPSSLICFLRSAGCAIRNRSDALLRLPSSATDQRGSEAGGDPLAAGFANSAIRSASMAAVRRSVQPLATRWMRICSSSPA